MTTVQTATQGSTTLELLAGRGYRIARDSQEAGVRDIGYWRDAAIVSLVAMGTLTTSPTLTYSVHISTGPTNPVIVLPTQEREWFGEDDTEMAQFLTLMDNLMERHTDLVTPVDEEQIARIANLVANVKV